jgi:thiamine biosynthesis lipoprotein
MGSDCHLVVVGGPRRLLDQAQRRVDDLEQRWSRFLPTSEVSRLNEHAGTPMRVSPDTAGLVRRALDAWDLSGGSYDPTVLGAVVRAGYDRSFELLGPEPAPGVSPLRLGAGRIEIDGDTVLIPAGSGFDPGGIGKGLAADVVSSEVMAAGADGVCVNLGGDVRVRGSGPRPGPGHRPWTIAVEHPGWARPVAHLGLADGAVATSTTLRRRWRADDGQPRHHLIDPATGLPSDTDLTLATVVAAQGWVAEVLAKAVLLRGSAHPFDIIGGTGAQALVVDSAGAVTATPGLTEFLGALGQASAYDRTSSKQTEGVLQ